jgi:hypothetical protein
MQIVDPLTGKSYVEKRRRRYNEPGQPRELTLCCYRRYTLIPAFVRGAIDRIRPDGKIFL